MTVRGFVAHSIGLIAEGWNADEHGPLDEHLEPHLVDPHHGQARFDAALARWREQAG